MSWLFWPSMMAYLLGIYPTIRFCSKRYYQDWLKSVQGNPRLTPASYRAARERANNGALIISAVWPLAWWIALMYNGGILIFRHFDRQLQKLEPKPPLPDAREVYPSMRNSPR